jgi:hypothetical protein
LLTSQHQQFGIGSEQFADSILKLVTGLNASPDLLGPLFGDSLYAAPALVDEGQSPTGVPGIIGIGAMATGLAAASGGLSQGTGEQVFREREAA